MVFQIFFSEVPERPLVLLGGGGFKRLLYTFTETEEKGNVWGFPFFLFFWRISTAKGQQPSRAGCSRGWMCLAIFLNLSSCLPQMANCKMAWGSPSQAQGEVGGRQLLSSLEGGGWVCIRGVGGS